MSKTSFKVKSRVIHIQDSPVTVLSTMSHSHYSVLKLALKHYDNSYGLEVLKSLEKAENP